MQFACRFGCGVVVRHGAFAVGPFPGDAFRVVAECGVADQGGVEVFGQPRVDVGEFLDEAVLGVAVESGVDGLGHRIVCLSSAWRVNARSRSTRRFRSRRGGRRAGRFGLARWCGYAVARVGGRGDL